LVDLYIQSKITTGGLKPRPVVFGEEDAEELFNNKDINPEDLPHKPQPKPIRLSPYNLKKEKE